MGVATRHRSAVTLIEIIVVLAIVGALLALLIPAVIKVRAAAARIESANNLRQIGLAIHSFAGLHQGNLPDCTGVWWWGDSMERSVHMALMPHLEQGAISRAYKQKFGPGYGEDQFVIQVYLSPADPTISNPKGRTSYAANAIVFNGPANLRQIVDGTSNTIAFGEHYSTRCGGAFFNWFLSSDWIDFPPDFGLKMVRPATFADKRFGDVVPVTTGNLTVGSVAGLTFQVQPPPADCDPRIPQTPHSSGMLATLFDGSVRTIPGSVSNSTFWGAVTPNRHEIPGDW